MRGSGVYVSVVVVVVIVVALMETTRTADDLKTRDGRIRALGEGRWEKGEVEKYITKEERRVVRRDPQDIWQVYLRSPVPSAPEWSR